MFDYKKDAMNATKSVFTSINIEGSFFYLY